jgi:hypothetical protein
MTTETQREALALLGEVWSLAPDIRLGRLFAHLGFLGEAHVGHGLGDIEDDEMIAILYRHRSELQNRLKGRTTEAAGAVSVSGSAISVKSIRE